MTEKKPKQDRVKVQVSSDAEMYRHYEMMKAQAEKDDKK